LEANISLINAADQESEIVKEEKIKKLPDYKVELKNINSFKFLKNAIDVEIERQKNIISLGKKVAQETRGYDVKNNSTFLQRSKEEAKDYRYFPEPDIPAFLLDDYFLIEVKKGLVEAPWNKRKRFIKDYNLNSNYIEILLQDRKRSDYFEKLFNIVFITYNKELKEEKFLLSNETEIPVGELREIPGMRELTEKYKEFHAAAKELLKNRKIAQDQPQTFMFDDRMEPQRVLKFIQNFYRGDINTAWKEALRYFYVNKLEDTTDRQKLLELINAIEYVQPVESKRKGAEREKKALSPEEMEKEKTIEEKTIASEKEIGSRRSEFLPKRFVSLLKSPTKSGT